MRQIDEFGVMQGPPIRRVIDKVKARHGVLHVSFDVDFLDPGLAPGVGTTVPGERDLACEAHLVMELLGMIPDVAASSISTEPRTVPR